MSSVEYRRLGHTGFRVSVPILGCMSFGDREWHDWLLPEEKAIPVLEAAWERGITTFDTANMYSNGESERILGAFVQKKQIPRERISIITKLRFLVDHNDKSTITVMPSAFALRGQRDYVNQDGLSRAGIYNQLKASLERLQTDYVDVLLIHMYDTETSFEETMGTLNDIVHSGKARYIGASNVRAWQLAEMNAVARTNGWVEFSCVELEHSLLYRTEEAELIAYCNFKGIGTLSFSPLMNGSLARPLGTQTDRIQAEGRRGVSKPIRPSDEQIISRVEEIAKKKGWSMAQVALVWSQTKVTSTIVGAGSAKRIDDDLTTGKALDAQDIQYLEEIYQVQGHRF